MRLSQLYKILQDTNITDELMLFIPAISSIISRASSSNVHYTTEDIILPITLRAFQNVTIEKGTVTPMAYIDPVFNLRFLENMGEVLYNKGYQMIELFIPMQLIQVLTPGSNLIIFYEDQKEVGVRTSISHKWGMIRNLKLKMEEKHMGSLHCLMNINTERK